MKVLFFARHFTYLRNFDGALRLLAERGHRVHIAVQRDEALGGREMVDRLNQEYPGVTAGFSPRRKDPWYPLATRLRLGLDYLRYLEPAYAGAPRLESRARERAPRFVVSLARSLAGGEAGRRRLAAWLWGMEQAVPRSDEIAAYIREQAPDAVLITPLIGVVASPELDYLYAAKALGIPTALCVWSWDHLSSKALIRTLPDRVLVWNPTQRQEAIELHGVPADRIVVTGAQCFDQWFGRAPSRSRVDFCRRVGLRDERPFVLWVCSSLFKGSPPEAELVTEWIKALRESDHRELRDANILVRPHPQRMTEWLHFRSQTANSEGRNPNPEAPVPNPESRIPNPESRIPNPQSPIPNPQDPGVAFWGGNPVDGPSRDDYFDSLHYSSAVVGLNTSAFLEGAIAGRPIYTVLLPKYADNQEGTIHFHYLLNVAGGLLHTARSLHEHAAQLAAALRGEVPDPDRSRRFVEAFVRPQGLADAATPLFVRAVEELPSVARAEQRDAATIWSRAGLRVLRRLYDTDLGRQWIEDPRERKSRKRAKDEARRQAAKLERARAVR